MAGKIPGQSNGLIASLGTLASTLLAILHTRLDLLCIDLEEERDHAFSLLLLTLTTLFILGIGTILAIITLAVLFWDTHRLLTLGTITGIFLVTGIGLSMFIVHKIKSRPRFLAASLAEIAKDSHLLNPYE